VVIDAYKSPKWGYVVIIEMIDPETGSKYLSTTMHHENIIVKKDDVTRPGQVIATGQGHGEQFYSGETGGAHVHWQLRRDGELIDPLTGLAPNKSPIPPSQGSPPPS
jgi:murein DD-endopeptidase MepM/ murein hydrolase activator NlpD